MIGFLRGRLTAKQPPQLVIDVGGVGYEVEAPMSTFYGLPPTGSEISLFTQLVVREDAHILFGFGTERERRLFRELLKVSNVGPKLALALLSGMSVDNFLHVHRGAGRRHPGAHPRRRPQDRRAPAGRNARPGEGIRRVRGRGRDGWREPSRLRSVHRRRRSARWSRSATSPPKSRGC